jgi:cytochrome c peroxidase
VYQPLLKELKRLFTKILIFAYIISLVVVCLMSLSFRENSFNYSKNPALLDLGHHLFFDQRLSFYHDMSCAKCHDPSLAYTDGYRKSQNAKAEPLLRNTPTLLNIKDRISYNWANPDILTIEDQMKGPLFNNHPEEMGFYRDTMLIIGRLQSDKIYKNLYRKAFHKPIEQMRSSDIIQAISLYIRNLESRNSKWDKFLASGDSSIFSIREWNGYKLFHSDSIGCSHCHGGKDLFSPAEGLTFANTGTFNAGVAAKDKGLANVTAKNQDSGKFRIPTLRNVQITKPYYHDGSETKLSVVVKNYMHVHSKHTIDNKIDQRLKRFALNDHEISDIVAYLYTLTDTTYLQNSLFTLPKSI